MIFFVCSSVVDLLCCYCGLAVDIIPVEEITEVCRQNNIKYFDLDFQADPSSLYPSPEEAGEEVVQWRR